MSHTQSSPTRSLVANGSVSISLPNSPSDGHVTIYATGDFGGGALSVSVSPDGTAWFPVEGVAFGLDETGYLPLTGILCRHIRLTLAGATAPNITITVLF